MSYGACELGDRVAPLTLLRQRYTTLGHNFSVLTAGGTSQYLYNVPFSIQAVKAVNPQVT